MTTKEAAAALGLKSYRSVINLCKAGKLKGAKLVDAPRGAVWSIPRSAVNAYQKRPETRGRQKKR